MYARLWFACLFFFGSACSLLFAQRDIDSLKNLLTEHKAENATRAKVLLELGWRNRNKNIEDAKRYSADALQLAIKLDLKEERAQALNYNGVIMRNLGNYEKALDFFFDALSFSEKNKIKGQTGYSYNNLGDIYKLQEDFEQAIEYTQKAIKVFESIQNNGGLAYAYLRLGEIEQMKKNYVIALQHFQKSLDIRKKMGNLELVVASMLRVGEVHYTMGKIDTAMYYYSEDLRINRKINNKRGIGYVLFHIARVEWEAGKSKEALEHASESYEKASALKENRLLQSISELLAKIYAKNEDFTKAYYFETVHAIAKEAVLNEEMKSRMEARQTRYEIDKHKHKHKHEIDLLNKDKERNFVVTIGVSIIAVLLIVMMTVVGFFWNRTRKQYKSLKVSEKILKLQKKELTLANDNLEKTLDDLQNAQNQLVEAGKMAALGQLIAGVAHEINNPLGAIKASGNHIKNVLGQDMPNLPAFFQTMNAEMQREFSEIIYQATQKDLSLTPKEDRRLRREWRTLLEGRPLKDVDVLAECLVEMGLMPEQYEQFSHILKAENVEQSAKTMMRLVELLKSTSIINTAVERASKIVFALKRFSHSETGETASPTNVTETVETVLTLYQNQIKRGIELQTHFEEVPLIAGFADELNQVWTNLIYNALQAMDFAGKLEININQVGKEICVSVKDSGKGIPKAIQERIFEAFFTTKPAGEGTGLGLSITKKIIDKHHGRIELESEEGIGTTFKIFLPIS